MTEILIKATQFVLSLSLLIVLHELGHFLPARFFKTRVEKFYLFFDPWFSLFKKKVGDTEYGIGWLPLGGYVKIAGMIDESMDTEQMKQPAQPWEFRSKPAWQRLIIMVGGVTVNVLLAFFIYAMMLFAWGKSYIPNSNLVYGVYADSLMLQGGFQHGDRILRVGGAEPLTLSEVYQMVLVQGHRQVEVERQGRPITIELPANIDQDIMREGTKLLFTERFPAVVDTVLPGTPAEAAGMRANDRILALGGVDAAFVPDLLYSIRANAGREVPLVVQRNGRVDTLTAHIGDDGKLGFGFKPATEFLETSRLEYGFFESFPAGVREGSAIVVSYVQSLKLLFSSEGVKQVGGFLTIGNLFDNTWNWQRFWSMTAFLSIILAVMNILPIPALDGGHVIFLIYEIIAGRQPNQKFMEYAQLAGIAILITLLLYANGMDLVRHLFR
jgi:regulator of sigma E protease